jgi:hypothetical protein
MIEGVHPSGTRYEYCNGKDLIAWGGDNLAVVDAARIGEFFAEVEALIANAGGLIAGRSARSVRPCSTGSRRVVETLAANRAAACRCQLVVEPSTALHWQITAIRFTGMPPT